MRQTATSNESKNDTSSFSKSTESPNTVEQSEKAPLLSGTQHVAKQHATKHTKALVIVTHQNDYPSLTNLFAPHALAKTSDIQGKSITSGRWVLEPLSALDISASIRRLQLSVWFLNKEMEACNKRFEEIALLVAERKEWQKSGEVAGLMTTSFGL